MKTYTKHDFIQELQAARWIHWLDSDERPSTVVGTVTRQIMLDGGATVTHRLEFVHPKAFPSQGHFFSATLSTDAGVPFVVTGDDGAPLSIDALLQLVDTALPWDSLPQLFPADGLLTD